MGAVPHMRRKGVGMMFIGFLPNVPLIVCIFFLARRVKRMGANPWVKPEPAKNFDFRVLASDLPESMPIMHSSSEGLYLAAKYGNQGDDWYNLLTLVSSTGTEYNIEIKTK